MIRLLLLLVLLSCSTQNIFSKVITTDSDSVKYRISYLYSSNTERGQKEYVKEDLMFLDIGQNSTKFYSYHTHIRDSIRAVNLANGVSPADVAGLLSKYKKGTTKFYYNYAAKKERIVVDNYALRSYYVETIELPDWSIVDERKIIAGYECQKAVARYLNRDWIVYFTPEIPISQGPWKLWGLPGLILMAEDEDGYFKYEFIGLEKHLRVEPIIVVLENEDRKKFTLLKKQEFVSLEKLSKEKPLTFIKVAFGTNITGSTTTYNSDSGEKGTPYIPLEPW